MTHAAKALNSGEGISLLQSLLSEINSRSAPRRALFSNLPFEIGPGLKISVKGYILFKKQEPVRSSYVYIGGEQPQLAEGVSTLMAEDTARTIEKTEVRKAFKFGGETITFTQDELKTIRNFGDPILRIIGFKPIKSLPMWANYKPSSFIYPSEDEFVGSTRVFSALQQKLLKDQIMGLAWFIPRKNAVPTLAAIVPGDEQLNDEGVQIMPPGLWVHPLPFADDVRSPPDMTVVRTTDSLVDMMRVVIQQLQLPKGVYDPSKYPNPSLQWFYRILQALALEEELPEKSDDKTIPRHRQIHKRAGQYVIEWGQELETQYKQLSKEKGPSNAPTGSKRSNLDNGTAPDKSASKKAKTHNGGVPASTSGLISDEEMTKHFKSNTISKLTVPVLKAWAQTKGIRPDGKKSDIVDQIVSHFETKMETD